MPVSKKRKPKRKSSPYPTRKTAAIPQSQGGTAPKKRNWQRIAIYVISLVMILSLALGYLLGNSPPPVPTPTLAPVESIVVTPAPEEEGSEESEVAPEAVTPEAAEDQ